MIFIVNLKSKQETTIAIWNQIYFLQFCSDTQTISLLLVNIPSIFQPSSGVMRKTPSTKKKKTGNGECS